MSTSLRDAPCAATPCHRDRVARLRAVALRALPRMYRRAQRRFVFRVRRDGQSLRPEGTSFRYTAIVLIGLAQEQQKVITTVLGGDSLKGVCDDLLDELPTVKNLGDAALTLWAATAMNHPQAHRARERLKVLFDRSATLPTVEVAWSLASLSLQPDGYDWQQLRDRMAGVLLTACEERSGLFRHQAASKGGLRGHVACFADLVYPIQALALYYRLTGRPQALEIANRCAERLCALQGPDGQWWWHYDVRSGRVIEGYPVYAVHQDAMAPMALFALAEAGGTLHREAIAHGLSWLATASELHGGSLIDEGTGLIWRKVARGDPRKCVRGAQALVSRVHPSLRVPGVDVAFPPGVIDDECRPYHLGWLLYAWSPQRARRWTATGEAD